MPMVFVANPVRRMIIQQCDKSRNRIVLAIQEVCC